MKCQKCGYSLPEDSEFCQYCGAHLEPQSAPEAVAVPAETTPSVEPVSEIASEPTSAAPQVETVQEESLMSRAYNSYVSTDPEEKRFFEDLLGTEELKAAYLEECARNQREYDKGVRVNFKQSYTQFMGVLHDEYFGTPAVVAFHSPDSSDKQEETPVVTTKASQKKSKQRYCKLCGQPIDNTTKKCTGCGKQYFKARFKPLYALLVILLLVGGYVGANYFCAVSAMNDEEFIRSKQFFDNLFVSETLFPAKYAYVEAGVLMEEGKYVESLKAFKKVDGVPIPAEITDSLKSKIYSAGQSAYKAGKMTEAKKNFEAITGHKRSDDYLLLISCDGSGFSSWSSAKNNYKKLVKLLEFENTAEIIIENDATAEMFLEGRWEDGDTYPYYFEMFEDEDGTLSCQYNLPRKDSSGYYYLSNGVYSVGETESSAVKYYKFSIIDEDTISVYCYKDGSTHKLYRQ